MESTDRMLAGELLRIKAVLLRPDQPFTWASGWKSPIYCDNRRILSDPSLRTKVASWLAEKAMELYPEAEVVAGVATGAIAHGVLAADKMGKPFVYVRPKPKDHGTGSQIEGVLPQGAKVVVIEDLISTGMSSLAAVKALREAGAEVLGMVAIFTYGFDVAAQQFKEAGVKLDTVSNYFALIDEATASGYVKESDTQVLKQWRENPSEWMK
ncbi:MAG: orotate phosphoribosyltransferase [Bacteroidales bacterium]|nr:orotate phosphoribosyltransferase [Bacteroidales bacterium]